LFSYNKTVQAECSLIEAYQDSICIGQTITFEVILLTTACNVSDVQWDFGSGAIPSQISGIGPHTIQFNQPGAVNFSVAYNENNDVILLTEDDLYDPLIVFDVPTEIISSSENLCIGSNVTLTTDGPTYGFYNWSGGSFGSSIGPTLVDEIEMQNQTYNLNWNINGMCNTELSYTINALNPEPIALNFNDTTLCQSSSILIETLSPTYGSFTAYIGQAPPVSISGQTLSASILGSVDIVIEWNYGQCYLYDTIQVSVIDIPSISIEPENISICNSGTVTLQAESSNATNNGVFSWFGLDVPFGSTGESISFVATQQQQITLIYNEGNCETSTTTEIIITDAPQLNIVGADETICQGESITLSLESPSNGSAIWTGGDLLNPTNSFSITVQPQQTQTYNIEWNDGACSQSAQINVNVIESPDLQITISDNNFCPGETILITPELIGYNGTPDFIWTSDLWILPQNYDVYVDEFFETTTINIEWNDPTGSCGSISEEITIEVIDIPNAIQISSSDTLICAGDTIQLTVEGNNNQDYSWFGGDIVGIVDAPDIEGFPTSDTYYFASYGSEGCLVTDSIKISVDELPIVSFSQTDIEICEGQEFTVIANATENGVLSWSGSNLSNDVIGATLTDNPTTNSDYTLLWQNGNGCTLDTTISVNVFNINNASASPDETGICAGGTIPLTASGGSAYIWTAVVGNNSDLSNLFIANPFVSPQGNSIYAVEIFDGNGQCTANDTVYINILPSPEVDAGEDQTICFGDEIILEGVSTGTTFIEWDPHPTLVRTDVLDPTANPEETTTYILFGNNNNGCSSIDSITVSIIDCTDPDIDLNEIVIPNAFTPNGDGVNDAWTIQAIEGNPAFSVSVFNQQGYEHINTIGYFSNFTGQESGFLLPEGTYYYIIKQVDNSQERTGTVTIIR